MKKISNFSFCAFSLFTVSLFSQPYGQHLYSHPGSELTSGCRTTINSNGFFMIGSKHSTSGAPYNFSVDKTDVNGAFAGSFIQRQYKIMESGPSCSGALVQSPNGVVVGIETNIPASGSSPAAWYAIAGAFNNSIFFATLDAGGLPVTSVAYNFPIAGSSSKPIIIESSTPNEYYIAGDYGGGYVYVLKVNSTGGIIWSSMYNDPSVTMMQAFDLVESPYAPAGSPEVLLLGHGVYSTYQRASDGFVLTVDGNNGNVVNYRIYGMPLGSCEALHAITVANSPFISPGFVMVGDADPIMSPGYMWILKIDPNGNVLWASQFASTVDPLAKRTVDVIERLNSGGAYEYYMAFNVPSSGMGVMKLDQSGAAFPGGVNNEFVYNQGLSSVNSISYENTVGGPAKGIHVYGTDKSGSGDHYMVQAYFNGKTGCNETLTTFNSGPGPNSVFNPPIFNSGNLTLCPRFALTPVFYDDSPVNNACINSSVPGGSNARPRITGIEETTIDVNPMQISPNPASDRVTITYAVMVKGDVKIELFNQLGQFVKLIVFDPDQMPGAYSNEFDTSGLTIESGVYFVKMTTERGVYTEKIIITK